MSSLENGSQTASPLIEISQLTRKFGDKTAVDSLSFRVMPGQVFGFIGPNGAGKTTTMKILATLDTPTSGSAWVDGFSVIDDPDRVRRRLGFMPDGFGTYPNINCEEYLDFFARSYGLKGKFRRDALLETMHFTQLDGLAQKPIDGLSKGMKQRLCLGRALIHNPSVLILDEPAAGLDPRARIELREMIMKLAADGKALLISSHILTELAEICDQVAIIEQGNLLAVGTVNEILNQGAESAASSSHSSTVNEIATIEMVIISDVDAAKTILREKLTVNNIKTSGKSLTFDFSSDLEAQAKLLADSIENGIKVVQFRAKERSLEDVFLEVTKGLVQ